MISKNSKLIIFGSKSFVSKKIIQKLKINNINLYEIHREIADLLNIEDCEKILNEINDGDSILFVAGRVPVKNLEMFIQNIQICKNICYILEKKQINHITYLSSDAVYKDSNTKIDENSVCEPDSLHGLMHLSREKYLESQFNDRICIIRPTLIYGIDDPHNGYGPNKFFRNALKNENIELFGKGEEKRDHVFVNDVAEIIVRLINISYIGKLNIVSGETISFFEIASLVKKIINLNLKIIFKKRNGPMPHNGYRSFNNKKIFDLFPDFQFTKIESWLEQIQK